MTSHAEDLPDDHSALLRELKRTHPVRAGLIGESPALRMTFARVQALASSDVPVLIHGEDGNEFEGVALALHWNSDRSTGPFVAERGANLREPVVLRQLFGHCRGAFTGANTSVPGLFDEANGGTLYLDEVADIPLAVQASLVRVLETGEYRPIGAASGSRSNFRLVASTTCDLKALVSSGAFRRDLYLRLRGAVLELPPLRERREDIPLLANQVLAEEGRRRRRPASRLSQEAGAVLLAYDWPGNVRELRAELLQAAALVDESGNITPSLFQFPRDPVPAPFPADYATNGLRHQLRDVEAEAIQDALRLAGGNKSEAARRLGVTRRTLYRRLAVLRGLGEG